MSKIKEIRTDCITVRIAQQTDQPKWDAYVQTMTDASPYHLFAWKEAVEESYNHPCYYLIAENAGKFVGLLPLVHIRKHFVINDLVALPFCDVGNCICLDAKVQDCLIQYALELGKEIKVSRIYLRGDLIRTELVGENFKPMQTGKVRMFLDLPSSSDELFSGFKSKLRSQILKAGKNDIGFRWGNLEDLEEMYHVFSKKMHSLGSPVHSKKWLRAILKRYNGKAKAGLTLYQKKVVGMGIILLSGKMVTIPWASTLAEFNRLNPNMLLYWNLLKFSADNDYKVFDFGRSSIGESTYKFKKQWGARQKPLNWFISGKEKSAGAQKQHESHISRGKVMAAWQKIPFPLANMLGPLIRKYISL